ncbi:hypothetical protein KOW79_007967 [Hemibagrus wyckioides]|uniref:Uncharacterized protein n=1 Tax=Hemibagrus wyckioides TaxID=337641 RepID=A0A9D3SQP8_9TELE|nr:hypothetical protein KOW79_007967 [Hemibagrus wyckioides]
MGRQKRVKKKKREKDMAEPFSKSGHSRRRCMDASANIADESSREHKDHKVIPLEEESGQRKSQLVKTQSELQQMIQTRLKKIQEINHSVELNKRNTEKEKSDSVEVFTSLIRSIERSQAELLEMMDEKQKAAEKQAEGLIKELEQEIEELKKRDAELEQLSLTDDHLHLLQGYPSLCIAPHTKNWTEISINTELSVDTLRTALSQLQETLNEKLSVTLNEKLRETELKRIQQYAVDVTLDPDTANPFLILSDDGKQVTILVLNYLDDLLILAQSKAMAASHRDAVLANMSGPEKSINTSGSDRTLKLKRRRKKDMAESLKPRHSRWSTMYRSVHFADESSSLLTEEQLQCSICLEFCTEGEHKGHNIIPLEEESGQRKSHLGKTQSELQQMIQKRLKKIQEINHSVELSKRNTEKEKSNSVEVFTALIRSIGRSQAELLKVMDEKQKAAEKQAEGLIKELEQEIEELKKRDAELEQLSLTDDHLHLLQVYPSLCIAPHTKNWPEISINTELSVDTLRTALSQLQETLNEKLKETELKKIQQYAVDRRRVDRGSCEKQSLELLQMIQERLKKIQEINHSVERNTEKEKSDSVEVFTTLILSIERSQAELLKVVEEKQKAAEKQAEGLIKELEQEIEELKKRDAELEQLSLTDDHLHLLQGYLSLRIAPHTKNWTEISINTELSVDALRTALSQLQETLNDLREVERNSLHRPEEDSAACSGCDSGP